jgi:hypothetical protein
MNGTAINWRGFANLAAEFPRPRKLSITMEWLSFDDRSPNGLPQQTNVLHGSRHGVPEFVGVPHGSAIANAFSTRP